MELEQQTATLVTAIVLIVGLGVTYAKTFAPYQSGLTQVAVDAMNTPSRYRPALNLLIGVLFAAVITVVAAAAIGNAAVIPAGIVAGVMGSIESQRVHDTKTIVEEASVRPSVPPAP
jgi:hypothetical protein